MDFGYQATSNHTEKEKGDKNELNLRHLSGHVGRTVMITGMLDLTICIVLTTLAYTNNIVSNHEYNTGIPPEMPKNNLMNAIVAKLQNAFGSSAEGDRHLT